MTSVRDSGHIRPLDSPISQKNEVSSITSKLTETVSKIGSALKRVFSSASDKPIHPTSRENIPPSSVTTPGFPSKILMQKIFNRGTKSQNTLPLTKQVSISDFRPKVLDSKGKEVNWGSADEMKNLTYLENLTAEADSFRPYFNLYKKRKELNLSTESDEKRLFGLKTSVEKLFDRAHKGLHNVVPSQNSPIYKETLKNTMNQLQTLLNDIEQLRNFTNEKGIAPPKKKFTPHPPSTPKPTTIREPEILTNKKTNLNQMSSAPNAAVGELPARDKLSFLKKARGSFLKSKSNYAVDEFNRKFENIDLLLKSFITANEKGQETSPKIIKEALKDSFRLVKLCPLDSNCTEKLTQIIGTLKDLSSVRKDKAAATFTNESIKELIRKKAQDAENILQRKSTLINFQRGELLVLTFMDFAEKWPMFLSHIAQEFDPGKIWDGTSDEDTQLHDVSIASFLHKKLNLEDDDLLQLRDIRDPKTGVEAHGLSIANKITLAKKNSEDPATMFRLSAQAYSTSVDVEEGLIVAMGTIFLKTLDQFQTRALPKELKEKIATLKTDLSSQLKEVADTKKSSTKLNAIITMDWLQINKRMEEILANVPPP
jgi:hypothetical protein